MTAQRFKTTRTPASSGWGRTMIFAIKAEVLDPGSKTFVFDGHKTMYEGKRVAKGDTIFVFASENEGGSGLVARGIVTSAEPVPRKPGIERQTPRVSIAVKRVARAKRPLGRTELNFKFYRQATNKIVSISEEAAAFLEGCF